MEQNQKIKTIKRVLEQETLALKELSNFSEQEQKILEQVLEEILRTKGKVAVIGIGKSGHIGKKISATLSSTGTPSFFLHPAELMHGDFGSLSALNSGNSTNSTNSAQDIVLLISNSGETKEIIETLPVLKRLGLKIISITSKLNSTLDRYSDYTLNTKVKEEACSLKLAPTTSTTVTLALGDALALALMQARSFTQEDFAKFHPGGSLGKKLLKTKELMRSADLVPAVSEATSYLEILEEISAKNLGFTCVLKKSSSKELLGIITDGDLRRMQLEFGKNIFEKKAYELTTKEPKSISESSLAEEALNLMQKHRIAHLIVISENKEPVGIIDLKDILKSKII